MIGSSKKGSVEMVKFLVSLVLVAVGCLVSASDAQAGLFFNRGGGCCGGNCCGQQQVYYAPVYYQQPVSYQTQQPVTYQNSQPVTTSTEQIGQPTSFQTASQPVACGNCCRSNCCQNNCCSRRILFPRVHRFICGW